MTVERVPAAVAYVESAALVAATVAEVAMAAVVLAAAAAAVAGAEKIRATSIPARLIYFLLWIQQSHRSVPLLYEAMSASTQLPAFDTARLLVEAAVAEESTEN